MEGNGSGDERRRSSRGLSGADRIGVRNARRDDQESFESLGSTEGKFPGTGLEMLAQAGNAGIDLPSLRTMEMRDERRPRGAAKDRAGVRKRAFEERIVMAVRRSFSDADDQQTRDRETTLQASAHATAVHCKRILALAS
jgi:hypothetical protein